MSDASSAPPSGPSLQFEHAQFEAATPASCAACGQPLRDTYFEANGQIVCPACRARVEQQLTGGAGFQGFLRASLFGAGAAVLGAAVYYAVLALTGYEIGLISIAVGWLVGTAVRHGTRGRGGLGYQILAVVFTYLSIASAYVPLALKGLASQGIEGALAILVAFPLALAAPFLQGFENIIGIAIIAFGLYQAWTMTRRPQLTFAGPFSVNQSNG